MRVSERAVGWKREEKRRTGCELVLQATLLCMVIRFVWFVWGNVKRLCPSQINLIYFKTLSVYHYDWNISPYKPQNVCSPVLPLFRLSCPPIGPSQTQTQTHSNTLVHFHIPKIRCCSTFCAQYNIKCVRIKFAFN